MDKITLPPSAASVWVPCPGSRKLIAANKLPPSDELSEKKAEGLAFHELSEIMLMSGTADLPEFINSMSSFGVVYDDEMYEGAQLYVNDIINTCKGSGHAFDAAYHVEDRVEMDHIYPEMYGRIDCHAMVLRDCELIIWDAKYGHKIVDPYENWAMILYADALATRAGFDGHRDQHITVKLRIVQPRSFHSDGPIREWAFTLSDLRGYINQAKTSAVEAHSDNAKCVAGPHCGNCDATHACTALQHSIYDAMDHISDNSGSSLTGTNLSIEYSKALRFEKLLKARLAGLESQVTAEVTSGVQGHMFTGVMGYGRLSWVAPREEIIAVASAYDVNAVKDIEPPLLTPTQLIKKGVDESVISAYSAKRSTGIKLVEINAANMRRIFEGNK